MTTNDRGQSSTGGVQERFGGNQGHGQEADRWRLTMVTWGVFAMAEPDFAATVAG
jgi:hypothetical protein